ncbi:right-handed parallel beta-helix repeat-containing protein [Salmonella enterica]|nr:right-handed parallel beta-helix repeat-containing protein [Salmonella enterica]
MANKPTQPLFPLGLETSESSNIKGFNNSGTIEHSPGAILTFPEDTDVAGLPSSVRYNPDSDEFEGYYENGGWLSLGGGGIRWETLPYAPSSNLLEGRGYLINNSTGTSTVVLPSPTRVGDSVTICDAYGKFATYPLTVSPAGNNLYGSTEDMTISTDNVSATFTWSGAEQGWVVTSGVGLGQGRVYSREIFTQILASDTNEVTLNIPPTIVDVYTDGKRLTESKYSLNGNVITFDPSLPAGTELQVIEYTPIQLGTGSGGSGASAITWIYNGGSAIGGETEITLDIVVDDVPAIDINGSRQYKNLGFTFDPLTSKITLTQELEPEDEVVVVINGTPNIYNQIDRSLQEVARAYNFTNAQVILSNDYTSALDNKVVIYDTTSQRSWGIPSGIPAGSTVVSVNGDQLKYKNGSTETTVTLVSVPGSAEKLKNDLASNSGAGMLKTSRGDTVEEELTFINQNMVVQISDFASLRTLVPATAGIRVKLKGYYSGSEIGGGEFISVAGDAVDDAGMIARVSSSFYWKRIIDKHITPGMYGIKGNLPEDPAVKLNAMFTAAAAANAYVLLNDVDTLVCKSPVVIPAHSLVYGNKRTILKRDASLSYANDFLTIMNDSYVKGIYVDGSRLDSQTPLEAVLVRIAGNVTIHKSEIRNNAGYGVVGNAVPGIRITKNIFSNFAKGCVAMFGDGTATSDDLQINDNRFFNLGAGTIYVGGYSNFLVDKNVGRGTYVGSPGNRLYVVTNTNGTITQSAGPDFGALKTGMFFVLPGGSEHMITAVNSLTSVTVTPPPPSNATVRAIAGTGDLLGIQSCSYGTISRNNLTDCVTYGTGGGTMEGSTLGCNYVTWEDNFIRNTGKNGINVGQSGAGVATCSILRNTLIQVGNGGQGVGPAYLLPWFDTVGIALYQGNPGYMANMDVSDNNVSTWSGDLNDGAAWFGMSGCTEATVTCTGNKSSGYSDGYVRGDILEVTLTGYGTGAAATSFVSDGESIQITVQTGTSPTASPYFSVRKAIRTRHQPMITAQIVTTTGNMSHCWGMQSSTAGNWMVGQNTTPSGVTTYYAKG